MASGLVLKKMNFTLANLLLAFWFESDNLKALRESQDLAQYRTAHLRTVRAAKKVNREVLVRILDRDFPIPHPWEGDGGLEH